MVISFFSWVSYRTESDSERAKRLLGFLRGEWFSSSSFSSSSSVCEQLLHGFVYPLAVKAHNVLHLVHQKECITLCAVALI